MAKVDIKRFAFLSAVNGSIVVISLALYLLFLDVVFPYIDFSLLLRGEALIVFGLQKLSGIPVTLDGTTFHYSMVSEKDFYIELIPECLGVAEILLFLIMLAIFRGVGRDAKIRGAVIFVPVIFIENILRLATLYPMAVWLGVDMMWSVHFVIWYYGQFAFLMLLFALWYLILGRSDLSASITLSRRAAPKHPVGGKEGDESHKGRRGRKGQGEAGGRAHSRRGYRE